MKRGPINWTGIQVDQRELVAAISHLQLAPDQILKALRRGMYRTINPVRDAIRQGWQKQTYRRHGEKRLHRRALVAGVRARVKGQGYTISGWAGVARRGAGKKYTRIVNVLEGGFTNRTAGRYVPGRFVVMRARPVAEQQAALLKGHVIAAAQKIIAPKGTRARNKAA